MAQDSMEMIELGPPLVGVIFLQKSQCFNVKKFFHLIEKQQICNFDMKKRREKWQENRLSETFQLEPLRDNYHSWST